MRHNDNKTQWQIEEASNYTHPLDVQLFADRPIFEILGDIKGKQVLDIGCGNGYLLLKIRQSGAIATGIDNSSEMIMQAKERFESRLCVATADFLPIKTNVYYAAICSLTINNFPSADITKRAFQEAFRILKPRGLFIISLPHPHTLETSTRFRWTDWENGQTQENLVPGEGFQRQIMGTNGEMISIVNYYWPKQTLINFAQRTGFIVDRVIEATASDDEIGLYSKELEPVFARVPFFLVINFIKPL
jgi:ubiquinone/menaquinone biosynthesis C-methylase UbiE